MTYSQIIDEIARDLDIDPKEVDTIVDANLLAIKHTMEDFDVSNISYHPNKDTDLAIHLGNIGYIITSKAKQMFYKKYPKHINND